MQVTIALLQLLLVVGTSKANFTLTLTVSGFSTSGNCDLFPFENCETFLSIFCLRGPRETSSTSTSDCPLGVNNQQIGPDANSGTRTISSTASWQGGFQMFIQAFDEDPRPSADDHLDDIIINREELAANSGPTPSATYSGLELRVSITMTFRIDCDQHFYGADCSVHCIAQNDDVNGHFTCDPDNGSRICLPDYYGSDCLTFCLASDNETNGFYTCDPEDGSRICRSDYYGSDCLTFCQAFNDEDNGFYTCDPDDGSHICLSDYYGTACLTFCQASDNETNGFYTCDSEDGSRLCRSDYYGSDCLTFCQASDNETNGFYTCDPEDGSRLCRSDYYGSDCLTFCQASDNETNGFYTCDPSNGSIVCREGFRNPKDFCRENVDDCSDEPCHNRGNCTDLLADFLCECAPGYTGETCSTDINECLEADCPANSTCVQDAVDSFACECLPGFEGENCTEIDKCLGIICPEGSRCVDLVDGYMCMFPDLLPRTKKTLIISLIGTCSLLAIVFLFIILVVCVFLSRRRRGGRASRKAKANSLLEENSPPVSYLNTSTPSHTVEDNAMDSDITYEQILPLSREDDITLSSNTAYVSSPRPHRAVKNSLSSSSHKQPIYDVPRPSYQPAKGPSTSNIKYKTLINSSCSDLVGSDSPIPSDPAEQHDYESIELLVNESFGSLGHKEATVIVNENVDDVTVSTVGVLL